MFEHAKKMPGALTKMSKHDLLWELYSLVRNNDM